MRYEYLDEREIALLWLDVDYTREFTHTRLRLKNTYGRCLALIEAGFPKNLTLHILNSVEQILIHFGDEGRDFSGYSSAEALYAAVEEAHNL